MERHDSARALLAAVVMAASCSSSSDVSGTDYARQLAPALCGLLFRCCSSAERIAIDGNATDPAGCEADFLRQGTKAAMLTAQGVSGLSYSGTKARRCLDAIEAASCTFIDDGSFATACGDVYVGAIPIGQACFGSGYCQAGLVCAFDVPDSEAGTCRVAGALGESCSVGTCGSGLYCATTGTCAMSKDRGAVCAGSQECATRFCGADQTCGAAPLACAGPPS